MRLTIPIMRISLQHSLQINWISKIPYLTLTNGKQLIILKAFSRHLYTLETNWLNTTSDLSESTDPDSLDYSSDYFSNTIANQNDKLIIGTSTYQYTLNGLLVNGVKSEEEGSGSIVFPQFAATSSSTVFCQYCDTCRNWQRACTSNN
jgi:hypothetical protein